MPENEGNHVAVLLDIGARLKKINDISLEGQGHTFGAGYRDNETRVPDRVVYAAAMTMVAEHPDVWYATVASTLMLASVAPDDQELENRLLQVGALTTAWLSDLRSRAGTPAAA